MKAIMFVVCASAVIAGCSVNGAQPTTAWGKKDVSMLDYRTDGGQCAVYAATFMSGNNAANSAGGINGANGTAPQQAPSGSASSGNAAAGGSGGASSTPTVSGGTYRDSASPDFVNRAAMQQRAQELSEQRARSDALKSCLTDRGYTEFALTPEQKSQLSKLPAGSEERREFLYKLGTNADVLAKQKTK